jgi:hypothetical protein
MLILSSYLSKFYINPSLKVKHFMKRRYIIFYTLIAVFNIFFWYYMLNFASVYRTSSEGWIYSSVLCLLILDWFGFSLVIPLFLSTIRTLVRRFPRQMYIDINFSWLLKMTNIICCPFKYIFA